MEKLVKLYEQKTGRKVEINPGGSGELMVNIQARQNGDLYVCHDPFGGTLMGKGLGRRLWTVAVVTPVIAVAKGNPKNIRSVRDLARPGLKLAMTDPNHSTTGYIIPVVFDKAGLRKEIEANIVKRSRGGSTAANWVGIGDVDAAIIWNAVTHLRADTLDAVPIDPPYTAIPGVDAVTSATNKVYDIGRIKVTLATLQCSKQPDAAAEFAQFVADNRAIFTNEFGFSPAPESAATGGKLSLHCGAGLRPAMEQAVRAFEAKTGAKIEASYQDDGALISTIRLKQTGDLYMTGDPGYLDMLATDGSVEARRDVAWFVPAITGPERNTPSPMAIGLLKYSTNKPLATRFMDFLAGPEGKEIFKRHDYSVDKPAGVGD